MGKGGRIACIFTPMALTIASLVCTIFLEMGGGQKSSTTLNNLYFMEANFTGLSVSSASELANTTTLTTALEAAQEAGTLRDIYQVHLWNYCTSNSTNGTIDYCSKRKSGFIFNPVNVWGLNSTTTTSASASTTSSSNVITSAIASAENSTVEWEDELLGKAGKDALVAYEKVAKWMFIAYDVSFWLTLVTVFEGIIAIFTPWGSLFTWIFSVVGTIISFAASITSTILYSTLAAALHEILHPYGIKVHVGTHALAISWLSTLFTMAATFFWLLSICCCSGRSNPHHRSNKGGLWNAAPEGGYGGYDDGRGRGSMLADKTGGNGYERVSSPYTGTTEHGQQVPLQEYPPPQPYGQQLHPGGAYEPYRHN